MEHRVHRVLFLCTGNSARSQMAEGLLRRFGKGAYEAFSAGSHPKPLNPLAVEAMLEIGIDISGQSSKPMDLFLGQEFDVVITVCDRARDSCPVFPGEVEQLHWSLDDPAAVEGPDDVRMKAFRRVRSELKERILLFLASRNRSIKGAGAHS
jgi:arsenate reductase